MFMGSWIFISGTVDSTLQYFWWTDNPVSGYYLVIMDVNPETSAINSVGYLNSSLISINTLISEETDVNVFPNPAKELLYFKSDDLLSGSIYLLNSAGDIVHKEKVNKSKFIRLNINGLSSGIYYYRILNKQGINVASGKVLVID